MLAEQKSDNYLFPPVSKRSLGAYRKDSLVNHSRVPVVLPFHGVEGPLGIYTSAHSTLLGNPFQTQKLQKTAVRDVTKGTDTIPCLVATLAARPWLRPLGPPHFRPLPKHGDDPTNIIIF